MLQAQGEHAAVGQPSAHNTCHIHTFEEDLVVETKCTLKQNGAEQGFVHCDERAEFEVEVTLKGRLADHLCVDFCVAVHSECYGPQDPSPLETKKIEHRPRERPPEPGEERDYSYTAVWELPADYFCPPDGGDCGQVCCFAVTVTSQTLAGQPGHIGCVCRGPCVMIHRKPAHD